MTWTQPLCRRCWDREHPHDLPLQRDMADRVAETCCMCGRETRAGIYAIYRPAAVPYPTRED